MVRESSGFSLSWDQNGNDHPAQRSEFVLARVPIIFLASPNDFPLSDTGIYHIWLVVFRPTPLKNDGVRQWER